MSGSISLGSAVFALGAAAVGSIWLTPVSHPRLDYLEEMVTILEAQLLSLILAKVESWTLI